ncbi:MAG: carboxypeptidase regulatory-like domain-containing protein [Silvibacterium sp.]|nr:carboxypeptidase regulatory-like domain-containing protein [Silvibacterium sp.]
MKKITITENAARKVKLWLALLCAISLLSLAPGLRAQENAGKIHGHVQDPTGAPMKGGTVSLSQDGGKTAKYSFTTDDNGNYTGEGIAPGTYMGVYRNPDTPADKMVDQISEVKITAGGDTAQDFDMTRPEYVSKLTPEQRKQLEQIKSKNAEVMKENVQIKNLNADLAKARDDNKNKNYTDAESLMSRDAQAKPDASVIWVELGRAQYGLKKNDDAVTSLKKAIELESASKKPNPDVIAAANDTLGEVYAAAGKIPDAQSAYEAAATADPKNAGMHFTNEAIMMDRSNQGDATVAAADKAIAADPNRPLPYYLKGKALVQKATVDPKGNYVVPPGCMEAYQKYLDLAPNGPFAPEVKQILQTMGSKVSGTYKAGKKS